ncbi:SPOR domain-containing protein [Meiothermus rufus]|uniref:SPOR domain-containing protein n=1 Tax=Meiothermus rufus TaxID=604332 RepID=UPI0003F72028|nr:SPOR domain-containing protein [Meiothermus rufus]
MGWLRTNWLDALIFLLVAVIMAGVVFFLTGVNPFEASRGKPPTTLPPQTQSPTSPQSESQAIPSIQPEPKPEPPPSSPTQAEPVVTVLPVPQAPASKPVPAPPKIAEKPTEPARPTPTPAARSERPVLRADAGGEWRVMVGSFGNQENAERLAASLRQQGYPVGLEPAGNFTRVWVGPYQNQARAQAIASTLGAYQPLVARMPASPPETRGAGRFLQVGAFRNAQSAQPVIDAVRQAGYPVVLLEEGGLLKVRVGPFEDTAPAAQALKALGLEVLEVR